MTLEIEIDRVVSREASLVWIVTTNKGWAHLRGVVQSSEADRRLPFRADLFAAASAGASGPDRASLRFYAAGTDPNVAGPILKLQGSLEPGSIAFGG